MAYLLPPTTPKPIAWAQSMPQTCCLSRLVSVGDLYHENLGMMHLCSGIRVDMDGVNIGLGVGLGSGGWSWLQLVPLVLVERSWMHWPC